MLASRTAPFVEVNSEIAELHKAITQRRQHQLQMPHHGQRDQAAHSGQAVADGSESGSGSTADENSASVQEQCPIKERAGESQSQYCGKGQGGGGTDTEDTDDEATAHLTKEPQKASTTNKASLALSSATCSMDWTVALPQQASPFQLPLTVGEEQS